MAVILNEPLNALEKLTKARVKLQERKPFFSYLAMHLKFFEDTEGKVTKRMAIDNRGHLTYNPEFVNSLSEEQIIGTITHEVMHCALHHLERKGYRDHELFNDAADIVTNNLLVNDGVSLPDDAFIPCNNRITYAGELELLDLHEKTSEEVYDEIYRYLSKKYKRVAQKIQQWIDNNGGKGFDDHQYGSGDSNEDKDGKGKGKGGKGNGKDGKDKDSKGNGDSEFPDGDDVDWGRLLVNAYAYAKSKGDVPAGMDRVIGKINETFIDWRGILYRYITAQIPVDYTYARPHKKSHSLGFYNPSIVKEEIDVYLAIDTSGSISQPELEDFLSEIVGIVNSFRAVNLNIIVCDCKIQGIFDVKHATKRDVTDKIKLKGGGGTSHIPVFKWIEENKPQAKLLIAFTDGYTDFPKDPKINTLWVVAGEYRASKNHFPFGKVIELPKRN